MLNFTANQMCFTAESAHFISGGVLGEKKIETKKCIACKLNIAFINLEIQYLHALIDSGIQFCN